MGLRRSGEESDPRKQAVLTAGERTATFGLRVDESEQRNRKVQFNAGPSELDMWKAAAKAANLDWSSWLRNRLTVAAKRDLTL